MRCSADRSIPTKVAVLEILPEKRRIWTCKYSRSKASRASRNAALKDLQAEGPSFGVKDYGAMVSFYEQQYKSLAK